MAVEVNGTTGVSLVQDGVVATADLADGAVTAAKIGSLPAGSVLQVVQGTFQNKVTNTTSTPAATGLSATITPSSTSSKILVTVHGSCELVQSGTTNVYPLYKNGSSLIGTFMILSDPVADGVAMSASYLDSPSSTSAQTYALYFYTENGAYTASFGSQTGVGYYLNSITLMEIAG